MAQFLAQVAIISRRPVNMKLVAVANLISRKRFSSHPDHHYNLTLTWLGETKNTPTTDFKSYTRELRIEFPEKQPLTISADPAFLGDKTLQNPEESLMVAVAGCHALSYLSLCARNGIVVTSYVDRPTGVMQYIKDGYQFTQAVLNPRITISSGDSQRAKELHKDAHHNCFIARSVNFPISTNAEIIVQKK